jgi:hypothetical protein
MGVTGGGAGGGGSEGGSGGSFTGPRYGTLQSDRVSAFFPFAWFAASMRQKHSGLTFLFVGGRVVGIFFAYSCIANRKKVFQSWRRRGRRWNERVAVIYRRRDRTRDQ